MRFILGFALLTLPVFLLCAFRQQSDIELSHLTPMGYKSPALLTPPKSDDGLNWQKRADGALAVAQIEEAARVEEHPTGLMPGIVRPPSKATPAVAAAPVKSVVTPTKKTVAVRNHRGGLRKVHAHAAHRRYRRQLLSRYH